MISIISAVAENGIIGKNNKLPWQLPADLAYFAKTTRGATVIMGLNTFKSIVSIIGKPLPGRKNIVIALEKDSTLLGCEQYTSIPEALDAANKEPISAFIIGGASIYAQTISLVDKLYITRVHANVDGDTSFPEIKETDWQMTSSEDHPKDVKNEYDYSFAIYERRK